MRNLSAENVEKDKEPTEKVEEVPATDKSIAEEAKRDETTAKANVVSDDLEKETADQVEAIVRDLDDELCPDEIYEEQFTSISVGTQTLNVEEPKHQHQKVYSIFIHLPMMIMILMNNQRNRR